MLPHGFGFYLYLQVKHTFIQLRLSSDGVVAYALYFFAEYIAIIKIITNKTAIFTKYYILL